MKIEAKIHQILLDAECQTFKFWKTRGKISSTLSLLTKTVGLNIPYIFSKARGMTNHTPFYNSILI